MILHQTQKGLYVLAGDSRFPAALIAAPGGGSFAPRAPVRALAEMRPGGDTVRARVFPEISDVGVEAMLPAEPGPFGFAWSQAVLDRKAELFCRPQAPG